MISGNLCMVTLSPQKPCGCFLLRCWRTIRASLAVIILGWNGDLRVFLPPRDPITKWVNMYTYYNIISWYILRVRLTLSDWINRGVYWGRALMSSRTQSWRTLCHLMVSSMAWRTLFDFNLKVYYVLGCPATATHSWAHRNTKGLIFSHMDVNTMPLLLMEIP